MGIAITGRGHLDKVAVKLGRGTASFLVDRALLGITYGVGDVHALEVILGGKIDVVDRVANSL